MRRELFFDHALTPDGWARDVRIVVADGSIESLTHGAERAGAEHIAGIAVPGLPNLHCHAFQRAMAGLAERRGPETDSFWTWRDVMYRFLARLSPDDVEAIAAFAYMEMLETGSTAVGEFHYLHHDVDGRPYADLGEMATRIAAASVAAGIGLTLLPSANPPRCIHIRGPDGTKPRDKVSPRTATSCRRSSDGAESPLQPAHDAIVVLRVASGTPRRSRFAVRPARGRGSRA